MTIRIILKTERRVHAGSPIITDHEIIEVEAPEIVRRVRRVATTKTGHSRSPKWSASKSRAADTFTEQGTVMERPANSEMVEGFMDGYDLTAPEPSANRSASYRHGFMCARIDKGLVQWSGDPDGLRKLADEAMEADDLQQTPGA